MSYKAISASVGQVRFEVLPIGRSEVQAAQLACPVALTVTCSPKHGPDRSVEVAARLRAIGHSVTVHVAARMLRDRRHLDDLLAAMADAGVDDLFLIGGDAQAPEGAYSSAVDVLEIVAGHPRRPATIGIAGYPEGHPLVPAEAIQQALADKSRFADYVTTQLCFDPEALRSWIVGQREAGIALPVMVGLPGKVARRRLLEMSVRIGVGPSLAFLRKNRGLRDLLASRSAADRLHDAVVPMLEEPELNVAGIHYFTFNQLIDTWEWQHETHSARIHRSQHRLAPNGYVDPERTTA
jgi:methylenetetrahydrofolate reductase (NADPH)